AGAPARVSRLAREREASHRALRDARRGGALLSRARAAIAARRRLGGCCLAARPGGIRMIATGEADRWHYRVRVRLVREKSGVFGPALRCAGDIAKAFQSELAGL